MRKFLMLFMITITLCGCSNQSTKENDIEKIMAENEYIIVDVRTKMEYDESHIVGAINIPHSQIDEKVELDKEKVIFVYCMSGGRSKTAYDKLKELGYTVYDLGAFSDIDLPKE